MNKKFNMFREKRMRQSDGLQENDSLGNPESITLYTGSNSQTKSTRECIDEDIRVKSVSINKGFKKILGTNSKVLKPRKMTDHYCRNYESTVLKDSSNIGGDFKKKKNAPLTSRQFENNCQEEKLLNPRPYSPMGKNAEKENLFHETEMTHELSISLEVSPSPCKNKVKNFKPTKNISHVENDVSNYYTQRKPD